MSSPQPDNSPVFRPPKTRAPEMWQQTWRQYLGTAGGQLLTAQRIVTRTRAGIGKRR